MLRIGLKGTQKLRGKHCCLSFGSSILPEVILLISSPVEHETLTQVSEYDQGADPDGTIPECHNVVEFRPLT